MPMYDVHCTKKGCKYTGEHLLRSPEEGIRCPQCESPLERNNIQSFNIGGGKKVDLHPEKGIKLGLLEFECSHGYRQMVPAIGIPISEPYTPNIESN
jgi:hypothetical protein